jgi:hypothetical protein
MVDPHITTLKQWDSTEDFVHPFVFILIIGTNLGVVSPWLDSSRGLIFAQLKNPIKYPIRQPCL